MKDLDTLIKERAEEFKEKSKSEIKKLSMEELVKYKKLERAYLLYMQKKIKGNIERKLLHIPLLCAFHTYHYFKNIKVTTYGKIPKTKRPIIFSISHIGMYDVEIVLQSIKKQAYLLSGDEAGMYRTFDGFIFDREGVIYVEPEDKVDSEIAFRTVVKYLNKGLNMYWNPEGTWNLTESTIILPLHYRIIEAAYLTNAIIIPIAIDQRDKNNGIDFIVNIGKFFDVKNRFERGYKKEIAIDLADKLRSIMSRLKYDIYENIKREDIDENYYQEFLEKRIKEWPFYNLEIIKSRMFDPNNVTKETEVFEHLNEIEINTKNAFLAKVKKDFNYYHRKDIL